MNRQKRNRKTSRQRRRVMLLTTAMACATSSVLAETRLNPFVNVSTRTAQSSTASKTKANSHQSQITVIDAQNAVIGSQDLAVLDTIDFDVIHRMMAEQESTPNATYFNGTAQAAGLPQRSFGRETPDGSRRSVKKNIPDGSRRSVEKNHSKRHKVGGIESTPTVLQKPRRLPAVTVKRLPSDTPLIAAARRHNALPATTPVATAPAASRWLPSITTESCNSRANKLLDDACREYSVAAWASAEASAWKALEIIATGIDVADRQSTTTDPALMAAKKLSAARTAIRESREFIISGAAVDSDLVAGIASSHQTPILVGGTPTGFTAIEATDRYLDHARLRLAVLATHRVQAAQAMDLIAAIMLGRNETKWLPEETALCLRRAALQGQPTNASLASRLGMQLADMGLDHEAQLTLNHAMTLEPNQEVAQTLARVLGRQGDRNAAARLTASFPQRQPTQPAAQGTAQRVPDVIQLTPAQFASISPAFNASRTARPGPAPAHSAVVTAPPIATPVANSTRAPKTTTIRKRRFTPASLAGFRWSSNDRSNQSVIPDEPAKPAETQSTFKRFMGKMPKLW